MATLPPFNLSGLLPPGNHELTLEELGSSFLVTGPLDFPIPDWDQEWRAQLVEALSRLVRHLFQIGILEVFIGGSFVEDKVRPNDIDGYFPFDEAVTSIPQLAARLNRLDPHRSWDWRTQSRRLYRGRPQLPMWHKYRVELYPDVGQATGLRDEYGNSMTFPAAFRRSKQGSQRGWFASSIANDSHRPGIP